MSCNCENQNPQSDTEEVLNRRGFMTKVTMGVGAFFAAALSIPLVAAMLDPIMRKKTQVWRSVGQLTDFKVGETKMVTFENASVYKWSGGIARSAAYVRREADGSFLALSVNCAHLGCPVRWVEKSEIFLCPCHGGVYHKDGSWAAGPPPRGMFDYKIRVQNNNVQIQTQNIPITNLTS